jgi:hypothetical protein
MSENDFEREVLERLAKIESKLETYPDAKARTYENEREIIRLKEEIKSLEDDVATIKDNHKWLSRTVIAEAIGVVGGIIIAAIKFL